jgi:hypothetical protein
MSITHLIWSLLLILGLVLEGQLVLRIWPGEEGRSRFAFYLLASAAVLLLAIAATNFMAMQRGLGYAGALFAIGIPGVTGALALLLLHLQDLSRLSSPLRLAALILALSALAAMLFQFMNFLYTILPVLAPLVLFFWLARVRPGWLSPVALLGVLFWVLINTSALEGTMANPLIGFPVMVWYFVSPGIMVGLAAGLVYAAFRERAEGEPGSRLQDIFGVGLAALVLGYMAYAIYWQSVWDQGSDGLGGIFLARPGWMAAAAGGMLLLHYLSGWRRLGGAAFAVIAPVLILQSFNLGWEVPYKSLTGQRAVQIQGALERYHADHGEYPSRLDVLSPYYLLRVPEPLILRQVGWCYRGAGGTYQLGTFYRETFTLPVSFRMYAQAGSVDDGWTCQEKQDFVRERYRASSMFEFGASMSAPSPAPLPESQPPGGKTLLPPLVAGENIRLGRWSGDGRSLLFSIPEGKDLRSRTHLYVLDTATGEVCRTGDAYLDASVGESSSVWLPGGGLIYVDVLGSVYQLEPCQPGHTPLDDLFGAAPPSGMSGQELEDYLRTTQTYYAHHPDSNRVLLKKNSAFWILDGEAPSAFRLEGIAPNPYLLHRDFAAFSPSGATLALARLDAPDDGDGSTLYLVDAASGQIRAALSLPYASEQSAPWLEWQTESELLLHGGGGLSLLNLSRDPPQERRLIEDIFGLGIRYPEDAASMSSQQLEDGTYRLALRINHPRNQATYVYSSATGEVQTFQVQEDLLLVFSENASAPLPNYENASANLDDHRVIWADEPERASVLIPVEGHTPRSYAHLSIRLVPQRDLAALGSSQGLSLHDLTSGERLAFYALEAARPSQTVYAASSPGGVWLVAVTDNGGLYLIPLPDR